MGRSWLLERFVVHYSSCLTLEARYLAKTDIRGEMLMPLKRHRLTN